MSMNRNLYPVSPASPVPCLETLFLGAAEPTIIDRLEEPSRAEVIEPVPAPYLVHPEIADLLATQRTDGRLWKHQALALAAAAKGENVLVTTGTGSGKSLTFQLPVLREMLEGEGRALVLYPQRALGSDQLQRWCRALDATGMSRALVGMIDGGTPMDERMRIVREARIVLATPDVVHAWLARLQSARDLAHFLGRLSVVVLDEAHAFDGVFGSNSAYLVRRLRAAARLAHNDRELQFLAASATMGDPVGHVEALTGVSFVHIGEADNGAPRHGLVVLHVEGPDCGQSAETNLIEIVEQLCRSEFPDSFLVFADSRQGVERMAQQIGDDGVLPYRSGYAHADRRAIEGALGSGTLKGCIATSALELGIDVAGFSVGFNLGLPATRKALRQRAGRIGRRGEGLFVIVAPRHAFAKLGTSLSEYFTGPVEPNHVYLDNPIVQFQQASCLAAETDGHAALACIEWPAGFVRAMEQVERPEARPREIRAIAALCGSSAHHSYPLRQIADTRLTLCDARNPGEELGEIGLEKALREAYPGATYRHMKRSYRVVDWRTCGSQRSILLDPVQAAPATKPMISTRVEFGLDRDSVLGETFLAGPHGCFAEVGLRVTEAVYGYAIGQRVFSYREAYSRDGRSRARYRRFASTGVILRITDPWFAGPGEAKVALRKRVVHALRAVYLAEKGILPSEVAQAHTGLWMDDGAGLEAIFDAVAIYDDLQGGLGLAAEMTQAFPSLLDRLRRAAALAGEASFLDIATVELLAKWYASLEPCAPGVATLSPRILDVGTAVEVLVHGSAISTTVTGHQLMSVSGQDVLMYSYALSDGLGWASHDTVVPLLPEAEAGETASPHADLAEARR